MITRIIYFPLNLSSVYIKNWETENKKRKERDRIPENFLSFTFFFFSLSLFIYLSIFIPPLFIAYYPLFVSLVCLDSSSFIFFLFLFDFISVRFSPPTFSTNLCYSVFLLFVYSSPAHFLWYVEKKNASLFIALTDRNRSRNRNRNRYSSRSRISTKEQLGFPFHTFNFFNLFLIPTPLSPLCCTARTRCTHEFIPRVHNNALVAISYNKWEEKVKKNRSTRYRTTG